MNTYIKGLTLAASLGLATGATAAQFTINAGTDYNLDGDSITDIIDELGYTGILATSIYDGLTPGSAVIDTNDVAVMNANGFAGIAGVPTVSLDGMTSRTYDYPANFGEVNIDALNPNCAPTSLFCTADTEEFASSWGLFTTYTITGTVNAAGDSVDFTGGQFDLFFTDGVTDTQVLRLLVESSETQGINLDLFGTVDYSWYAGGNSLVDNFFTDLNSGTTYYDSWLDNPNSVRFELDTNVNPPFPGLDELVVTPTGALVRQSTLDGSITFQVPEPGVLALLGIGLLGFGATRRKLS